MVRKTLPVNDNYNLCVFNSVESVLPGLPWGMTLPYCVRTTWFEMKDQMKISETRGTPNRNMLKGKKVRGQPVWRTK